MMVLGNLDNIGSVPALPPFDEGVLEFFSDLSRSLTKVREYSDVATFGFWCRKAALLAEKAKYDDLDSRLGRGVVFHSTPSNVPVNFAFSFAAGLLSGNANIVRLPGKDFEQVSIITDAVAELLADKHNNLAPYVCFVKYPPDRSLHDRFSSICDVRVIWGGDGTIRELRESSLKPRAIELTFADRYSAAVINADGYLVSADKAKIAQDFYNDTYFNDQNACTAPKILFWLGSETERAKAVFWESVQALAEEKYSLAPVQSVGKLGAFYRASAGLSARLADCGNSINSFVTRACISKLTDDTMDFRSHSGFFLECDIDSLHDILPVCGERLQTLAYFGVARSDIERFVMESRPRGIDRVVPIGSTMDFSLTWDGHDLIRAMTRVVKIS
ncbi:MAG: hypothetical protein FWC13_00850 [Oscillospiraceae bacterium]|nr:hypothetical protein [Oscillospiraceae bacterium]